jgi:gamma-glutamylcyclotransferase
MNAIKYFSYGSNLLKERIQARCPSARKIGTGKAVGLKICFGKISTRKNGMQCGKANLVVAEASSVWGVIYEMPESEFSALSEMEKGYSVFEMSVNSPELGVVVCAFHNSDRTAGGLPIYDWYLQLVVVGAKQNNLPSAYIEELEDFQSVPDPGGDNYRDAREARHLLEEVCQ